MEEHLTERMTIPNHSERTLTLIVEPWANEYHIAPGAALVVEVEGPAAYASAGVFVEWFVSDADEVVSAWAWDGADARVLEPDGRVVADWTGLRVPRFAELDQRRESGADIESDARGGAADRGEHPSGHRRA